MTYSTRFYKIARLLFTSEISEEEKAIAQKIIKTFETAERDLEAWADSVEKNLEVFNNYHEPESQLVVITEKFEEVQEKLKQKYERMIQKLKEGIELLNKIQDVEIQEMISGVMMASEEYTELYNKLTDMPYKIGEVGFIREFKEISQKLVDNNQPFFDAIQHIKDYLLKNVLDRQALS